MICLFFCRFLRFFLLQDLKYVLLRLQKAITKVEQGMKVTFSSYRRFLIDLCDNPGAWHGRIPNRVRRVCPWQAWCWHHRIPGHFSYFWAKSFPPLQPVHLSFQLQTMEVANLETWAIQVQFVIALPAIARTGEISTFLFLDWKSLASLIIRKDWGWKDWGRVGAPSCAGGVYHDPAKTVA